MEFLMSNEEKICYPVPDISSCPHTDLIKEIYDAFPDGPENHKEYHQALIDAAKAQRKFWDDLTVDLKKNGIKGIILVLLGLIIAKLFGTEAVKFALKLFI